MDRSTKVMDVECRMVLRVLGMVEVEVVERLSLILEDHMEIFMSQTNLEAQAEELIASQVNTRTVF